MSDSAGPSSSSDQRQRGLNVEALKQHVLTHKIDCGLWAIRVLTILFTCGYFLPIFGSAQNAYYKALIANAAINALRLHQRLGRVRLSREFVAQLLMEDSCHYLFYSMIFIYVAPLTLVLLPVVLFAILHSASYSLTLLDTLGQNSWWGARLLISLVEFQSLNILRLIAFTEIIMMPLTVLFVAMGRASLLTPFIYYHFLTQRYTSRRNPYNRNMFHELRILFEKTAAKPNLPSFVKSILLGIINFTVKLAPPQVQAQHQQ
ncbi:Krueppel homolog 2 [Tribolium castaneum]|uniref:Krueppel homolog 2-like Protein n=1 Tax=Tribolium castaneum TaxID=7070 RepID=D2A0S4_TRICA|nr:PREDICTED: Krueppel homolog 2 [Tribolium castaneum]EFA01643.1 Krueppel homolog 2-like Protein [Tribolium castaneum]|eukprot:XP_970657.1 PREDICTED: Krueppel homolog 2 [Tribolium castaneum]